MLGETGLGLGEPFCACGRRWADCDGSRTDCSRAMRLLQALANAASDPRIPEWRPFNSHNRLARRCACPATQQQQKVCKGERWFLLQTCPACGAQTGDQITWKEALSG